MLRSDRAYFHPLRYFPGSLSWMLFVCSIHVSGVLGNTGGYLCSFCGTIFLVSSDHPKQFENQTNVLTNLLIRSIDAPHNCSVGSAGIQSAIAASIYWLCCVLTCCFPRPDPFCEYRKKREEEQEEVVVVKRRVIVEPDVEQGYNADQEPKDKDAKKKKRKPRKPQKDKITDADFDTPAGVSDEVDRVEYKETTLPDGSRKVDEITHYFNGRQAVKTTRYRPGE